MLMIGSATKPKMNKAKTMIVAVRNIRSIPLLSQRDHFKLLSLYSYLQVGHCQRFRSDGEAPLQARRQPSWTYCCDPLHLQGRMSLPSSGSSETYLTRGFPPRYCVERFGSSKVGSTSSRQILQVRGG